MNTFKVLKGFFVVAVAFFGFTPSAVTSASNLGITDGAAIASCPAAIASGGSLPSGQTSFTDCTAAEASVYSQMTGTYLPGVAGGSESLAAVASVSAVAPVSSCLTTLRRDLETVLPSGLSEAQACDTLQGMGIATQSDIIPVTGGQADTADPIACWHDAGASVCQR